MVPQSEIDALVERIKALVVRHGGQSDKLEKVRGWYAAFQTVPEPGAFVALEHHVKLVEDEDKANPDMQGHL